VKEKKNISTFSGNGILMKKKILFICTHNSARSQMAEGYMKAKFSDRYEVFSAGTEATRVHPMAITVMQEIGIDISGYRSKLIDELFGKEIETVVTVCDSAQKACPFFPGAKEEIHQSFPDPSAFSGTDAEIRTGFRRVRDEIIQWIDVTFGQSGHDSGSAP
jgi:arsenate reductase